MRREQNSFPQKFLSLPLNPHKSLQTHFPLTLTYLPKKKVEGGRSRRRRPSTPANKTKLHLTHKNTLLSTNPNPDSSLLISNARIRVPNRTLESNNNINQASSERLDQGSSINRQGVSGLRGVSIKNPKVKTLN